MYKKLKIYGIIILFAFSFFSLFNTNYSISNRFRGNLTDPYQMNDDYSKDIAIASSVEWYRIWGDPNSNDILQAMDVYNKTGDVYLVGSNDTSGSGYNDIVLVKYNNSGDYEWNRSIDFDTRFPTQDIGMDVDVDQATGDIYLTGEVYNASFGNLIFVAKYDSDGYQKWNNTWGYYFHAEWGYGVSLDDANYVYVIGSSGGKDEIVLIKFDKSNGLQVWNTTWNETLDDGAYGVACDQYGGIYVTGYTYKNVYDKDMVLIKFNETGQQQWNKTGGNNFYNETAHSVAVDSEANIYVTGVAEIGSSYEYMFLQKYDNESNLLWEIGWADLIYGGKGNDIYITSNGTIMVAVEPSSNLRYLAFNSTGSLLYLNSWDIENAYLSIKCVSGYGLDNIYIAGVYGPSPNQFIIVKNPNYTTDIGNGGGAGTSPGDGDNDDGDNGVVIPFGNTFLLFTILAVVSISVLLKKKIKSKVISNNKNKGIGITEKKKMLYFRKDLKKTKIQEEWV